MSNEWDECAFRDVFPTDCVRVAEYNAHESYEGWGAGIAKNGEGYWAAEYSHCSCHGPFESRYGWSDNKQDYADGPFPTYEEALRHIGVCASDLPAEEPVAA